ncbi:phage tail sheath family protein [Catellatospora tritici]|uniref:phage tail sheath family protein n=1 Tax=Catellatospora tritici TaxID=2851566 RepID=UPI001C2CF27F|nr:phage tail sheath subtilisin-like domain-containing protein [Catellatospora tritici]MBV1856620.1 phage tail sheath subtilisin-like domain-containing protein [Catellatospora tritici]
MPSYLRPDVYIEEFPGSGLKPSTWRVSKVLDEDEELPRWSPEDTHVAFIGLADSGPLHTPVVVKSWNEFGRSFGMLDSAFALGYAVYGFFANGGRSCFVMRVDGDAEDLLGEFSSRDRDRGVEVLAKLDEVSVVCAPDLVTLHERGRLSTDELKALQLALIAHCEMIGDRIALIDSPADLDAQGVRDWRYHTAGYDSSYAALYYPWLRVFDPVAHQFRDLPPSGHVAGAYARVDHLRGVHHAPANEMLEGAVSPTYHVMWAECEYLHPIGVNPIVFSAGGGPVVWGNRTLSSDPSWRYIHRRRVANFLARNIRKHTRWAIFSQASDPTLGPRLLRQLGDLLDTAWRSGVLYGDSADEAFWLSVNDSIEERDRNTLSFELSYRLHAEGMYSLRIVYFCG